MSNITKNGESIIAGSLCSRAQTSILRNLTTIHRPTTVPEIARQISGTLSDASLYTLLRRLDEKGNLVFRDEVIVQVQGRPARRVMWSPSPAVVNFFSEQSNSDFIGSPEAEAPG